MDNKVNIDSSKPPLRSEYFISKPYFKPFRDKGYIPKEPFTGPSFNGVHLLTKLGKNMKTKLFTPLQDAYHLRKEAIIVTIFDQLKNICQVEYSRHRPIPNNLNNIFACLTGMTSKTGKFPLKITLWILNNYYFGISYAELTLFVFFVLLDPYPLNS